MLPYPESKVWLYHETTDLRKSYLGLSEVVRQELNRDPRSGEAFIFVNRDKSLAKVIWWDRTGWCLLLKKLSGSRFRIKGEKYLTELQIGSSRYFFDGL